MEIGMSVMQLVAKGLVCVMLLLLLFAAIWGHGKSYATRMQDGRPAIMFVVLLAALLIAGGFWG